MADTVVELAGSDHESRCVVLEIGLPDEMDVDVVRAGEFVETQQRGFVGHAQNHEVVRGVEPVVHHARVRVAELERAVHSLSKLKPCGEITADKDVQVAVLGWSGLVARLRWVNLMNEHA